MYHGNVLEMVIKYELNYVVSQTNLINSTSIVVMQIKLVFSLKNRHTIIIQSISSTSTDMNAFHLCGQGNEAPTWTS